MSAFGLHPTFKTLDDYAQWRRTWRALFKRLSADIRRRKKGLARLLRYGNDPSRSMRELHYQQVMAHKLMTLLKDAKVRRDRIIDMERQIAEQDATFPIAIDDVKVVDVHFNRIHNEFPNMPMWVVKFKGKSYYVRHIDFTRMSFSTHEKETGSTKGMLRFRNCKIVIDETSTAKIFGKIA